MQVCTSLQTDNHASTPPLCFLQAGCPSCQPTNSVKALKARQNMHVAVNKHISSDIVHRDQVRVVVSPQASLARRHAHNAASCSSHGSDTVSDETRGVARSKYVGCTDMASAEREPITGVRRRSRPPICPPCKNSDLYQFQERPLAKVG